MMINKAAAFALADLPADLDAEAVQRCIEAIFALPVGDVVPVADIVVVVRCKDCKLWSRCLTKEEKQVLIDTNTDGVCAFFETDGLMPNDFCSYGQRKEAADGQQ